MAAFIFWLLAIIAIEPLYSDYTGRLADRGVAVEALAQIEACREIAGEAYAARVEDDPWWGVRSTLRVLIGTRTPGELLGETVPNCADAFRAADAALSS